MIDMCLSYDRLPEIRGHGMDLFAIDRKIRNIIDAAMAASGSVSVTYALLLGT
jgi:hypothetical protein